MMKFILAFSFLMISTQSFAENTARELLEKDLIKTKKIMVKKLMLRNHLLLS